MKKIAIVNQRYGIEVNGGSEYFTKILAEKLNDLYDVTVLTTKALEYNTWANYYIHEEEEINNVKIKRFSVNNERNPRRFSWLNRIILRLPFRCSQIEKTWLVEQGPYCTGVIEYIQENKENYDVFIFITYLYYLTAVGLPIVKEKSILIPTAHEEPYIRFHLYQKIFENSKAIIFLTKEEEDIVRNYYNIKQHTQVLGMGIEEPKDINEKEFLEKYQIDYDYIIYVGRVDTAKNCNQLFEYFTYYKKLYKSSLKLLVLGKVYMNVPQNEDIKLLGFVSEEEKFAAIKGAKSLVLPSEYESLSISVLEAMSLGTPVIVYGKCEVLKAHCLNSNSGAIYNGLDEFMNAIQKYKYLQEESLLKEKENAIRYIKEMYSWDFILGEYEKIIEGMCKEK